MSMLRGVETSHFTSGPSPTAGGCSVLSQTIVPTGAYFQTKSTLTKAEIEIATNVINGHWRAAYGNYEHEKIGIEKGGLAPEKVAALIAGLPTSFDDPRQQVVYELASTLAAARVVPLGLYRRARDLLADAGIVDVTTLMGWFTTVSLTLMPTTSRPMPWESTSRHSSTSRMRKDDACRSRLSPRSR